MLTAKLIPVTFTVNNASPTQVGDYIFLTGNTVELGNWSTTWDGAVGPMLTPNYPNWFTGGLSSGRANDPVQVHQDRRKWRGHVGGRKQSHVHRSHERDRLRERQLAVLRRSRSRNRSRSSRF